jgi:peptide/nickel transport system ATP-binding protein
LSAVEAVSPPVAEIRDLRVSFPSAEGQVQSLRGVSLDIAPGEIIALVGESGSGKTVLGQSILGLAARLPGVEIAGSVWVAGVDMLGGEARRRRWVQRHLLGAVFQDPLTSLNPTTKIGRQLTERGITATRALENLRDAGVPQPALRARQFPHELSGGLRQRTAIAMALGTAPITAGAGGDGEHTGVALISTGETPQLIIADEPTTALDVSVQAQIVLLFDRLRREHGCAVFFVTHDLGVAASIADRIVVLYAGRVCEVGPARDVLARPSHWYTRALLAARISVNTPTTVPIRAIPGAPPNPAALPPGCPFAPRCVNAQELCDVSMPDLAPRPAGDGGGSIACFYPQPLSAAVAPPAGDDVLEPAEAVAPQAPPSGMALELASVTKRFTVSGGRFGIGGRMVHAVSDVSLRIESGGALALVGESGCGKTTTLRVACGLIAPDSGTVHWGTDAGRPQLVFQDAGSSLTPWMTVGALIEEQLVHRGIARKERSAAMLDLLARVGLDARAAGARARNLSGGQRQRAAIARALAAEPRLLICDEPVSALDASLAIRILELLQTLRRDFGVALMVVTHDLGVARRVAETIAVMYRGQIVEQGPVETVFAAPRHPYTEGLLAAIPTTEPGRLSPKLAGEPPSPIGIVQGCAFAPRCPYARPRCTAETPILRDLGDGRRSACHFAEELGNRL